MTKLKQINPTFPTGDCQRTVFACLLECNSPLEVPNFTEMEDSHEKMCKNFTSNVKKWLDVNNLNYIEMNIDSVMTSSHIPLGYCTIVGKSPRGEHDHIVIGKVDLIDNKYHISYEWDTSPLHEGIFLDGSPKWIGFLSKSCNHFEKKLIDDLEKELQLKDELLQKMTKKYDRQSRKMKVHLNHIKTLEESNDKFANEIIEFKLKTCENCKYSEGCEIEKIYIGIYGQSESVVFGCTDFER